MTRLRRKQAIFGTVIAMLAGFAGRAPAQELGTVTTGRGTQVHVLLTGGTGAAADAAAAHPFSYPLFASEIVAYVAKEVLSDAQDEFADSPIPGHLSPSMPDTDSRFGSHCLHFVAELGSRVSRTPALSGVSSATSTAAYAARGIAAALAIRDTSKALRHKDDDAGGFSLAPKLGTNKLMLRVTFRW
jgi:hypothetical protein